MHKTLIITAHPSSKGFTHQIAAAFKESREKASGKKAMAAGGTTVEILDLYKTDLKQGFLTFENIREMPADPVRDALQKKILEADELVFIHPMWWLSPPAIMKNFLDNNFGARFAYKYELGGKRVGLLGPRTARVYITCDGPLWIYILLALPFWSIWSLGILHFCGLKVKSFSVFDKKRLRTEKEMEHYLRKVRGQASRV